MSAIQSTPKIIGEKNLELNLAAASHKEHLVAIGKALSSPVRIDIMNLIKTKPLSLQEIARLLQIPLSSTAMHIRCLEDAGLIITENQPGIRGSMRVCMCHILSFHLEAYDTEIDAADHSYLYEMPVGSYYNFDVSPTCGLAGMEGIIDCFDNPVSFYSAERQNAQLIWFSQGFLEYRFPNKINRLLTLQELSFSLELCSEAPGYSEDWPSDITFYINDQEVGTYTCPGDFGVRRGKCTPDIWPMGRTQYGLLTSISLRQDGGYINESPVNPAVSLSTVGLDAHPFISFKVCIKSDAVNIGGVNIFGEKYGDHPQGICMRAVY
ncbi:ArsR family transcriptional regulator [Schaedlerella arabinosiphila]|uniref:ArsR family transcriptional regulator n=1 Tax=Schaedlerella arabinosiphila TaxID=2044587 RepID=A0A3R8L401_9FIRM|nr:helix-turn-helix domain-containing protein [Schaedlerella arabinosiphila]RRK34573.1 ArsR family transcriptional regulator [Schaedlerella arabinosiphila]